LRSRQAFANVRGVNVSPLLALAGLAAIGLLATRLPSLKWRHVQSLDPVLAAGGPLVLLGIVLGPGIDFISRPVLQALAPVTALAVGWIGAVLGARFEWRYVRRIPRGAWLLSLLSALAAFGVVGFAAWLCLRLVPALGLAWTPRVPAILTLAAVAAVSGPGSVALAARAAGIRKSAARLFAVAAALETACGALVMTVPLALHRPYQPAGSAELGWLYWIVFAVGSGALVGMLFLSLARLVPGRTNLGFALLATLLFGAGVGYAADLSPFLVCALAAALIVNRAPPPRRHLVRRLLAEWEHPIYAVFLVIAGALFTLPTWWVLAAVPLLAALRVAARWAAVYVGRAALRLTEFPPHVGLGTVAQGGAAMALGLNFFILYGGRGTGAGGAVLTTIVLGVALAQLVAQPLLALALKSGPTPLTPAPALPELSSDAPADWLT